MQNTGQLREEDIRKCIDVMGYIAPNGKYTLRAPSSAMFIALLECHSATFKRTHDEMMEKYKISGSYRDHQIANYNKFAAKAVDDIMTHIALGYDKEPLLTGFTENLKFLMGITENASTIHPVAAGAGSSGQLASVSLNTESGRGSNQQGNKTKGNGVASNGKGNSKRRKQTS